MVAVVAAAPGARTAQGFEWPIATSETFVVAPNGSRLYTRIVQPDPMAAGARRFPAVVTVPGGTGDGAPLADRASWREVAALGFVVVAFNAEGRGAGLPGNLRSDGVADCNGFGDQSDLKAVIEHAAALSCVDPSNLGVFSMSFGLAMAAGTLGRYPALPVAYLIDEEGPHDSRVVAFQEVGREAPVCGHLSTATDPSPENIAFWAEREAVRHVGGFGGRYLRLQAEVDHAQGRGFFRHAIEMIRAATDLSHGGDGLASWTRVNMAAYGNAVSAVYTCGDTLHYPRWVPGRLSDHARIEVEAVKEMAQLVGGASTQRVRRHLTGRPATTPAALDSPFGLHPAEVRKPGYAAEGYADALAMGVRWTRPPLYALWSLIQPDLGTQVYDFTLYDQLYGRIPAGMCILANIEPEGGSDEGRTMPSTYLPVDEQKYVAFVKATIERYDGDGLQDMPGLANPITYWQVGNEPSTARATGFADLQRMTYQAIKEACPTCQVVIGGATGMPPVDAYIRGFDSHFKPILDALGGHYVDVMDVHWYGNATGDYRGVGAVLDHVRAVLDAAGFGSIPVWITEMGSYSGDPSPVHPGDADPPPQTEAQQASDYLKRYVYSLSLGIRKVFPAFGLMEGFKHEGGYFDHTGFLYDGLGAGDLGLGVRKLSFYTYRKMTDVLEGSSWETIRVIRESSHVYVYMLIKNGAPLYVAWWDTFADPAFTPASTARVTLSGVDGTNAVVTEAVPDALSGRDVTDFETAFRRDAVPVSAGTLVLDLGESPVLVEVSR